MSDPDQAPRTAMILAAGRGQRMRPLTDAVPKPLLRVAGQPLIHHHVMALARAGFDTLVINLAWLGDQIRDYLQDGARYGLRITYSEEHPAALETGGGIFRALRWLAPGPFLVVNGDIFCDIPLWRLRLPTMASSHLVLVPNPPQHTAGDFGFDGRHATVRTDGAPSFTFSGVGLYRESFFEGCRDGAFPLQPLLMRSVMAGACTAQVHRGAWDDVGTPARLRELNERV